MLMTPRTQLYALPGRCLDALAQPPLYIPLAISYAAQHLVPPAASAATCSLPPLRPRPCPKIKKLPGIPIRTAC